MDELVGFTAREKYILNAYRDRALSKPSLYVTWELTYIIPSLLFISFYFWYKDVTWLFVGYALLLFRTGFRIKQTILFLGSYRSIFAKYEAKIQELMEVQQERE
ncbi:MAG: hypothetical protein KME27_14465 [Lyngbya sp. HA4199-MV5]|jgi:hypothetical protein|nr:hypothetical protein [Lyngbya sp. HA4199-MV5]